MLSTSTESLETCINISIPEDLMDVFSKAKASGIPLHRPYNYAIDFLSRIMPLCSIIYPWSHTEQLAMEEYIEEALKQVCSKPYTSPASARLLFCEEEGGRTWTMHWLLGFKLHHSEIPMSVTRSSFFPRTVLIFTNLLPSRWHQSHMNQSQRRMEDGLQHYFQSLPVQGNALWMSFHQSHGCHQLFSATTGDAGKICGHIYWWYTYLFTIPRGTCQAHLKCTHLNRLYVKGE